MKDTEVKRWLYQDSEGFKEGIEVGKKEIIDKAFQWITEHIDIPYEGEFIDDSPVASDYIEWCEKQLYQTYKTSQTLILL